MLDILQFYDRCPCQKNSVLPEDDCPGGMRRCSGPVPVDGPEPGPEPDSNRPEPGPVPVDGPCAASSSSRLPGEDDEQVEEDDNITILPTDEENDAEGSMDEEQGEVFARLAPHFAAIRSMGLRVPPLPRPLQESKRAMLRGVKQKYKRKSHKQRNRLVCKSRAAPKTHRGRWEP